MRMSTSAASRVRLSRPPLGAWRLNAVFGLSHPAAIGTSGRSTINRHTKTFLYSHLIKNSLAFWSAAQTLARSSLFFLLLNFSGLQRAIVLHYNVLSRLIVTIFIRLFGLPMIGYYGDFGFSIPPALSSCAMDLAQRICALMGVVLKDEKECIWSINGFLGPTGEFPSRRNGFALIVSLSSDNALKWQ